MPEDEYFIIKVSGDQGDLNEIREHCLQAVDEKIEAMDFADRVSTYWEWSS